MGEKIQINFVVDVNQKDRWEQAIKDDYGHNSLSQFIRTAVEQKLSDTDTRPQTDRDMSRVLERLETLGEMQRTLRAIDGRLQDVEHEVKHDPETANLASELFDVLPTTPSNDEIEYRPGDGYMFISESKSLETGKQEAVPLSEVTDKTLSRTGLIEAFAEVLDTDTHDTEQAAKKLTRDTAIVRMTDDGRYYVNE